MKASDNWEPGRTPEPLSSNLIVSNHATVSGELQESRNCVGRTCRQIHHADRAVFLNPI